MPHLSGPAVTQLAIRCANSGNDSDYAGSVRRILLTGMSGTGKSTLICELAARRYKAIDADADEWSEWLRVVDSDGVRGELDWVWREDRIQNLLSTEDADVLFISSCATNQMKFYSQFDHIVLLSARSNG